MSLCISGLIQIKLKFYLKCEWFEETLRKINFLLTLRQQNVSWNRHYSSVNSKPFNMSTYFFWKCQWAFSPSHTQKDMFTFFRKSQTSFGNECWFLLVFLCKYCFFNLYYIVRFIVLGCLLCCSTAFLQCNPLPKLFDLFDKQHLPFSPWLTIL